MTFMNDFVEEEWSNMKDFLHQISVSLYSKSFLQQIALKFLSKDFLHLE